MNNALFRIGCGSDTHRLKAGLKLVIGGVHIPCEYGAEGHSDADVLLHALCDALLGAASLEDIGHHFPNTSAEYKDISSRILLEKTYQKILEKNYRIINIDSIISLEKPKLATYIPQMRENISNILEIHIHNISIKAKSGERIGFIGERKGLHAQVVLLLQQRRSYMKE